MPQSRRYKKKKSAGKAILAWIIVLAILAAGVFVFVSVFYEDAKKKLDEMNYPPTAHMLKKPPRIMTLILR